MNREDALKINSWCFQEAIKVLDSIDWKTPKKGYVLFETGYGPSGLPHIGTFGEVARTKMIMFAFSKIAPSIPMRLFCFSDDMDGLRKVPTNIPNQELIAKYIDMPLTSVPDAFGEKPSYGEYMNNKLCQFLDSFNFSYEFCSSTDFYKKGLFNDMLKRVAQRYDQIMEFILPSFRDERRDTYSPFMPICNKTGKVVADGVISIDAINHTIKYKNFHREVVDQSFLNGGAKLQWKVDFGMRWAALDVNFEMYGKDVFENEKLYRGICEILGCNPPVNYCYEHFLDNEGKKISKSKGNGITVEEWLKYAPQESLAYYMYNKPKTAKKLYFDVIPKSVDEYISFANSYHANKYSRYANPCFYIHEEKVPSYNFAGISFSMLLNLAAACNPESDSIMWGFISKYDANFIKGADKFFDQMVNFSIAYYNDFIKPSKKFKIPNDLEKRALASLKDLILTSDGKADSIQQAVYDVSKEIGVESKDFFATIYSVVLGLESGPRVGSFVELFGIDNMTSLIESRLN